MRFFGKNMSVKTQGQKEMYPFCIMTPKRVFGKFFAPQNG